jgi:hypothetical protein
VYPCLPLTEPAFFAWKGTEWKDSTSAVVVLPHFDRLLMTTPVAVCVGVGRLQ